MVRENLEKELARRADAEMRLRKLVKAVADRCEVDIPHVLVHRHSHSMAHDFLNDLMMRGINPQEYLDSNPYLRGLGGAVRARG